MVLGEHHGRDPAVGNKGSHSPVTGRRPKTTCRASGWARACGRQWAGDGQGPARAAPGHGWKLCGTAGRLRTGGHVAGPASEPHWELQKVMGLASIVHVGNAFSESFSLHYL